MATGGPVQLIKPTGKHSFELDVGAARRLLLDKSVRDKKVCIISVAGAYRKGKSFLLDFFIRYLSKASTSSSDLREWLGKKDEALTGFKWRGGSARETTGIWAWSKVFHLKELAIILMDTQGTFDSQSSVKECASIFALSGMISSTLIYNLSQNIQENDLQHLQFFSEYGKFAVGDSTDKPFQTLMFLVRDWSSPDEYSYGLEGGNEFLRNKFQANKNHDLRTVRSGIRECYSQMECFLLPHPGKKVADSRHFNGKLSDLNAEFRSHLEEFVPYMCSPVCLKAKQIGGRKMTCAEILPVLESYTKAFRNGSLPPVSTLFETTAEVHYRAALERTKDWFTKKLRKECGADKPFRTPDELENKLREIRRSAEKMFSEEPKIGSRGGLAKTFLEKLRDHMDRECDECTKVNDNKANPLVHIASMCSNALSRPFVERQSCQEWNRWTIGKVASFIRYFQPPEFVDMEAVRMDNLAAQQVAMDLYTGHMNQVCGEDKPYVDPAEIREQHKAAERSALSKFREDPKEGGDEHTKTYERDLRSDIEKKCEEYLEENKKKHWTNDVGTPAFVAVAAVLAPVILYYFWQWVVIAVFFSA